MSKIQYPPWLTGIHQVTNQQPSKHPTNANPIRVVAGSRPKKKKFTDNERRPICINFAIQLDNALINRATILKKLLTRGAISKPMQMVIANFYKLLITTTAKTTQHTGRTPPKISTNAKALRPALQKFQVDVDNLVTNSDLNQLHLADVLNELCIDVEHYANSIEWTLDSYAPGTPIESMRNRPPNHKARSVFIQIVEEQQKRQGNTSYPRDKFTLQQLEKSGHKVKERTLRLWKQQLKNGTFGHYIQPKSGNK
jgi:hypothetical protein